MSFTTETKFQSNNDRWLLDYYGSMSELLAVLKRPAPDVEGKLATDRRRNNELASRTTDERYTKFAGASFEEALELAKYGWSAGRPKLDAILEPVRERLMETLDYRPEISVDVTGFEPDVDLYLDGELECMREYMPTPAPHNGKVFNLVVNVGPGGWATADTIFAKGAAIVALVESLQVLGYDLNIYAEDSSAPEVYGQYDWHTVLVKIHNAGDNLDINSVMFPLGHPAWMRRIMFGVREHSPEAVRRQFGYSMEPEDDYSYEPKDARSFQWRTSHCSSCHEEFGERYTGYYSHCGLPFWPNGSRWHPECCPGCNPKERYTTGYGSIVRVLMSEEIVDASFTLSLQSNIGADSSVESVEKTVEWVLEQLRIQGVWEPSEET